MAPRLHRPILIATVLLAAALRLGALDRFPPGLHFDEAVYGLMAKDILEGARPVYFSSYTGREPLYMYLMATVFGAAGPTAWAIRLTSALIGVATMPLTYVLGRTLYGRRVGIAAAAFLAVHYWHLTVSRNGYPNILIPPIEAAAAYWLWRGWRGGRLRDWALGGGCAGLVLYTYLSARFYPVFLGVLLVYAAITSFGAWRRRLPGMAVAMASAALVFGPLGLHFARHPADFFERANQVLAWQRYGGADLADLYVANIRRTVLAFVVPGQGDPRWHYNLPGRAIFQPLVAPFFLLGLAICLRRARDLRYAIPILWLAVLALPGILTDEMQPAGQRIFGMFPALAIVPAIGLSAAGSWIARLSRSPSTRAAAIAAALVALVPLADGAITVRDYFFDWARQPQTAHIFNADYAEVARAAARDLAAARSVVILSQHYKHPTVVFLAPEATDRVVWAEPRLALPIPNPAAGSGAVPQAGGARSGGPAATIYYRLTSYLLDDAPATRWLEAEAVDVRRTVVAPGRAETAERDEVPLEVVRYEVPAGARLASGDDGHPAAEFDQTLRVPLADGSRPIVAPRDDPLVVAVDWTVVRRAPDARGMSLQLRDRHGTTWAGSDGLGVLAEQWHPGDQVRSWFTLDLDREMPPGEYTAHLLLTDAAGRPLPWRVVEAPAVEPSADESPADESPAVEPSPGDSPAAASRAEPALAHPGGGVAAPVAAVRLTPDGARRADEDVKPAFVFDDGLAILGTALPEGDLSPGAGFKVGVTWARMGAGDGPADLAFTLVRDGRVVPLGTTPVADDYPPRDWREREILRGRYVLTAAARLDGGPYTLRVARTGAARSDSVPRDPAPRNGIRPGGPFFDLGTVRVGGVPRTFVVPRMAHRVDAVFGGTVRLLGYDLDPAPPEPGADLALTLYWQAIDTPEAGGTVFTHLFGADGVPIAQHDGVPGGGARPLAGWLPGEVVADRHVIAVPAGAAVETLSLGVGVYDPETGARWAVAAQAGAAVDGRLRLGR